MIVEDAQLTSFVPRLDAQFRARCMQALRQRGRGPRTASSARRHGARARARARPSRRKASVLAYILLATDIVLARPEEHIVRSVEAILAEMALPEWQRVRLAGDYFRQFHEAAA
jgi:hypothetical protein